MPTPSLDQGRRVQLGDVGLNVVEHGPADGPPVLLLHGFPEFHYGWRHQLEPLATAGRRVIAPDQRGYNRSDKPLRSHNYRLPVLAQDAAELLLALSAAPAVVVGHDWGAAVAWWLALTRPELVSRLVILNVPHPQAMRAALSWPGQWLRSWYVGFFQLPSLPEFSLRAAGWRGLWSGMTGSAPAGLFGRRNFERYRQGWEQPGALTAMLNWYRALLRQPLESRPDWTIEPRTTIVWGGADRFLESKLAELSLTYCRDGELRLLPGVSHWVQHERPQAVIDAVLG